MRNDDNPYSDDNAGEQPMAGQDEPKGDQSDEGSETTVAPKSIFQGKVPEPGDVCKFRVEGVGENDVELSWVPDDGESKGSSGEGYGNGAKDPDSMASMME